MQVQLSQSTAETRPRECSVAKNGGKDLKETLPLIAMLREDTKMHGRDVTAAVEL